MDPEVNQKVGIYGPCMMLADSVHQSNQLIAQERWRYFTSKRCYIFNIDINYAAVATSEVVFTFPPCMRSSSS